MNKYKLILIYSVLTILGAAFLFGAYKAIDYSEKRFDALDLEYKLEKDLLCYELGYKKASSS